MPNLFESLTVVKVLEMERKDGTGSFPVVVLKGVSFTVSSSGSASFTKREVNLPLNKFTLAEGKAMFPEGKILNGWTIEAYEVEEYEFSVTDPETGEVTEGLRSTKRYRPAKIGQPTQQAQPVAQAPQSTTEPVPTPTKDEVPEEVGTDTK